jgi:hypothetical protein
VVGEVLAGPLDQSWAMMVYEPYALTSPVAMSFTLRSVGTQPLHVCGALIDRSRNGAADGPHHE